MCLCQQQLNYVCRIFMCCLVTYRQMEDSAIEKHNSDIQKLLSQMLSFDRYFTFHFPNQMRERKKWNWTKNKYKHTHTHARTHITKSYGPQLIKVPFTLRINRLGYLIKIFATTVCIAFAGPPINSFEWIR